MLAYHRVAEGAKRDNRKREGRRIGEPPKDADTSPRRREAVAPYPHSGPQAIQMRKPCVAEGVKRDNRKRLSTREQHSGPMAQASLSFA